MWVRPPAAWNLLGGGIGLALWGVLYFLTGRPNVLVYACGEIIVSRCKQISQPSVGRRGEWGTGTLILGKVTSAWELTGVFRSDSGIVCLGYGLPERLSGGELCKLKGCEAVSAGLKANLIKASPTRETEKIRRLSC